MVNTKNISMLDHIYNMSAPQEACDEDMIEKMEIEKGTTNERMPLLNPNPKKIKKNSTKEKEMEVTNTSIFESIQAVLMRFDEQDKRLKIFESA